MDHPLQNRMRTLKKIKRIKVFGANLRDDSNRKFNQGGQDALDDFAAHVLGISAESENDNEKEGENLNEDNKAVCCFFCFLLLWLSSRFGYPA